MVARKKWNTLRCLKSEVTLGNQVCSDLCTTTVLMCDDVPYNLLPLEVMLTELEIASRSFESGLDAVKCFQQRLQYTCCSRFFKLVLTDIAMPILDGYEVCN